jgi:hypothetical protein
LRGKYWRVDARAIVGSVLLGTLMTVLGSIVERIDASLTGGAFVILGAINFYTWNAISSLFFRLPGGIITGLINALISFGTAASPMSVWFIPTNMVAAAIFVLVAAQLAMNRWWHYLVANVVSVWISMLVILLGLLVTINLPISIALTSYVVTSVAGTVGATILSYLIALAVERSNILQ